MNDTFSFYKAHGKLLVGIALVPGVLQAIVAYLAPSEDGVVQLMVTSLMLLAAVVLVVVISIYSVVAMVLVVAHPSKYHHAFEAFKDARTFFLPMLFVAVLSSVVIIGGFILFIIPGVIFMIWYSLMYFTLILEHKRGWDAMKSSKAYVQGRWWSVFGRVLAIMVVLMALSFILEFLLTMIMPTEASHKAVSALISSLYAPFSLTYMYFIYKDLKAAPAVVA